MNCDYSFRAQCNGITVDYGKRYKLTGSKIEIELFGQTSYRIKLIEVEKLIFVISDTSI